MFLPVLIFCFSESKRFILYRMKEVLIENDLNMKIYINGIPDYDQIIAADENGFLEVLERRISELENNKRNLED